LGGIDLNSQDFFCLRNYFRRLVQFVPDLPQLGGCLAFDKARDGFERSIRAPVEHDRVLGRRTDPMKFFQVEQKQR